MRSEAMERALEGLFGIPSAIKAQQCVSNPVGCGREISNDELMSYGPIARKEYEISGLCRSCHDKVFNALEEDQERIDRIEDTQVPPDEKLF